MIDVSQIKHLLGDRILVRPLARPERRGALMLPASALNAKGKQSDIWWGVIESLGRDAKYPDAYGLTVGDTVGIEFVGRQCETIAGEDGEEHIWVAEEFFAAKDSGRMSAFRSNGAWNDKSIAGLIPLGAYCLVRPEAEEESRGGIHIPHSARDAQKLGECIAVSEGELRGSEVVPLHVPVGGRVLFGRYSGAWVKIDEELLLMKQEDVVAVMEKEVARV